MSSTTIEAAAPVPLRQDAAIIAMVGLAHASSHFSHLLLPLMFPVFMTEFSLSYSELGLLMSVFFIVSGMGQATGGFLVDRMGARPVLFGALTLFMLACVVAASAGSYAALMLVAVLAGLGNSPFHPVDFTIMNQRVSQPRLGYAFSVHGVTGNLGWAVAPLFFATISSLASWRVAYLAAAGMYGAILLLVVLQRDKISTQSAERVAQETPEHALAFLRRPVVWWCFGFFLLSTMTLAVVQTFSVSLLQALHHVSFEAATLTLTAYMLCAAAGTLVGGFVAARIADSDRVVAICMSVAAVFLALCGTGIFGAVGIMVVLAATGFAIGIGGPSRDMMIRKATPRGATGRVYGLVYSGLDVGFAISPVLFGALMDRGLFGMSFYVAALILLLAVGAALGVGRRTEAQQTASA
jgi:MFS transporter, FSR family, fosmidomycin resistance protein